ncbi:hypothetical protein FIBSPDRAFT_900790 [Athelia psychrophila]|uniref:Uncharacterized protein n=1 Tax=Athelia psychrophila TaxID=1759441 RepID=A0A165Y0E8_9AGAM|nr:hypothetical protein FIBSPDRAFT_900790 [Fibularhizoctonia sp. CBS 109695]
MTLTCCLSLLSVQDRRNSPFHTSFVQYFRLTFTDYYHKKIRSTKLHMVTNPTVIPSFLSLPAFNCPVPGCKEYGPNIPHNSDEQFVVEINAYAHTASESNTLHLHLCFVMDELAGYEKTALQTHTLSLPVKLTTGKLHHFSMVMFYQQVFKLGQLEDLDEGVEGCYHSKHTEVVEGLDNGTCIIICEHARAVAVWDLHWSQSVRSTCAYSQIIHLRQSILHLTVESKDMCKLTIWIVRNIFLNAWKGILCKRIELQES